MRASEDAYDLMISTVLSVDPLSEMINSKFPWLWPRADSMALLTYFSPLKTGKPMETRSESVWLFMGKVVMGFNLSNLGPLLLSSLPSRAAAG